VRAKIITVVDIYGDVHLVGVRYVIRISGGQVDTNVIKDGRREQVDGIIIYLSDGQKIVSPIPLSRLQSCYGFPDVCIDVLE
jgi:hypothetical protein